MSYKILLIEDDEVLRHELKRILTKNLYDVVPVTDFDNVLEIIKTEKPHLVLMDINLPGEDGFYYTAAIREFSAAPIIFLTARSSHIDEVMGFTLGGDDYITKPYNTSVLLARISSLLSRAYASENKTVLTHKGVSLNLADNTVEYNGQKRDLTKNEFRILYRLFMDPGKIITRYDIMNYLWENELFIEDNTLNVNIARVRQKLSEMGAEDFIMTKRSQGYMI